MAIISQTTVIELISLYEKCYISIKISPKFVSHDESNCAGLSHIYNINSNYVLMISKQVRHVEVHYSQGETQERRHYKI